MIWAYQFGGIVPILQPLVAEHLLAYKSFHFIIDLNDSSEVCNPKCKEGQCCSEGQCFCIDNTNGNPEMKLCEGIYTLSIYSVAMYCTFIVFVNDIHGKNQIFMIILCLKFIYVHILHFCGFTSISQHNYYM